MPVAQPSVRRMAAGGFAVACASTLLLTVPLAAGASARGSSAHRAAAPVRVAGPASWTMVKDAPAATRVIAGLNAVAAVSAADAWAVGGNGDDSPLILRWNGVSWKRVAGLGQGGGQLLGVAAVSAHDAWAVGFSLILHWNGTRWRRMSTPGGYVLHAVAAWSARNAWAVGSAERGTSSSALILRWNGVSWKRVAAPGGRGAELAGVTVTSARSAWAVGGAGGRPLVLHWNGTRWTRARVPALPASLYGVAATSARNVWAVGVGHRTRPSGCDLACPLVLHWNGRSWRRAPSANPPSRPQGNWLFAVTATARSAWAVGGTSVTSAAGHAFILRLERGRWRRVPSPGGPGGTILFGVAATSLRNAWAVGYGTQSTPPPAVILHWNGTRWTRVL